MKHIFIVIILSISSVAQAGMFDSIKDDIKEIEKSDNMAVKHAIKRVSKEVKSVAKRIERESYLVATKEQAFTIRLAELESMVTKQRNVISKYEKLVFKLETRISELENAN